MSADVKRYDFEIACDGFEDHASAVESEDGDYVVASEHDATVKALKDRVSELERALSSAHVAIEAALEYFEDREDVVDGSYGPAPNKEMQLAQELRLFLAQTQGEKP